MFMVNQHYYTDHTVPWHILCDFDGTISLKDTTDYLLETYAKAGWEEIEEEWEQGKIGSKVCMQKQIELLNVSIDELQQCLDQIEIDLGFIELVKITAQYKIPLTIVSDGLDFVIRHILKKYNLEHLPVIANHLVQTGERSWRLEFPNQEASCISQSGTCKCKIANQKPQNQIILIGDGRSDYCLAGNADYVFAKKSLIDHCRENHIFHTKFENFVEIYQPLAKLLSSDFGIDTPVTVIT
ncbi:MtnX-like HAD-IB family phosphatase [Acinetobacter nosocomialis]|uniref:MtnX-like HAD-IB family phosphatase n=1 Tax=Acinetobacter nosocomialis TaxID=106654 RepID=UPI001B8136BD|nr:MtnX-like HAD-IB family phosphatase [Acinetobacter nosocomialis]MBR7714141.1 MtnX-like HAD-IB family phosphatase [Acinetobacter nosocomialis]